MGQYTELYIGKYFFSWKNEIPDYLAFIFEDSDFYSDWDESKDWFTEIGYKTTRELAIRKLEKFGFTIEFLAEIYDSFYDELYSGYEYYLKEHLSELGDSEAALDSKLVEKFQKQVELWPKKTRIEEWQDFQACIKSIISDEYKNPWSEAGVFTSLDGRKFPYPSEEIEIKHSFDSGIVRINLGELLSYLSDNILDNPPWLFMIVSLLTIPGFGHEYPEIITLMFLRSILDCVDEIDAEVKLELSDIIPDEESVHYLLSELGTHLIDKISLYNKVFHKLFLEEEDIKTNYIKTQCRNYLNTTINSKNSYEKGKNLEKLTEILFTSNNSLELVNKRVSTGDEEIDLLIKNNINRPFWIAFRSPLFFVECKNWKKPVGSKEIRDFEIKLHNHGNVVKVGFFVSINGFSSGAINELKRLGRDEYHIVAIDFDDINEFINSSENFFEWLEERASKIH